MTPYSPNTITAGSLACLLSALALGALVISLRILYAHRMELKSKHGSNVALARGFPLLLRCCFALGAAFALVCCACTLALQWLRVEEDINIDPFHRASISQFDEPSRCCSALQKFAVGAFALTKLFAYLVRSTCTPCLHNAARRSLIVLVALSAN